MSVVLILDFFISLCCLVAELDVVVVDVEETTIVGVACASEGVGDGVVVVDDGVPVDSPEFLRDNGELEVAVGLVEMVCPEPSFDDEDTEAEVDAADS